jgi:hypothetical protein
MLHHQLLEQRDGQHLGNPTTCRLSVLSARRDRLPMACFDRDVLSLSLASVVLRTGNSAEAAASETRDEYSSGSVGENCRF